jgi:hypothetical protein
MLHVPGVKFNLISVRNMVELGAEVVFSAIVKKPIPSSMGSSEYNIVSFCQNGYMSRRQGRAEHTRYGATLHAQPLTIALHAGETQAVTQVPRPSPPSRAGPHMTARP